MVPVNNSDLAWLVVSDYNQDNDIGFPDDLREDIYNPAIDQWTAQHIGIVESDRVGNSMGNGIVGDFKGTVGSSWSSNPGYQSVIGSSWQGYLVGGNEDESDQ